MTLQPTDEWEKEFDYSFVVAFGKNKGCMAEIESWRIKDFIRSLLSQAYKEGFTNAIIRTVQWMNKKGYEGLQEDFTNALTDAQSIIGEREKGV